MPINQRISRRSTNNQIVDLETGEQLSRISAPDSDQTASGSSFTFYLYDPRIPSTIPNDWQPITIETIVNSGSNVTCQNGDNSGVCPTTISPGQTISYTVNTGPIGYGSVGLLMQSSPHQNHNGQTCVAATKYIVTTPTSDGNTLVVGEKVPTWAEQFDQPWNCTDTNGSEMSTPDSDQTASNNSFTFYLYDPRIPNNIPNDWQPITIETIVNNGNNVTCQNSDNSGVCPTTISPGQTISYTVNTGPIGYGSVGLLMKSSPYQNHNGQTCVAATEYIVTTPTSDGNTLVVGEKVPTWAEQFDQSWNCTDTSKSSAQDKQETSWWSSFRDPLKFPGAAAQQTCVVENSGKLYLCDKKPVKKQVTVSNNTASLYQSIEHGILKGTNNVLRNAMRQDGYDEETIQFTADTLYYAGYWLLSFMRHCQNNSESTVENDHRSLMMAAFQASYDLLCLYIVSEFSSQLSRDIPHAVTHLRNAGYNSIAQGLVFFSQQVSEGTRYAVEVLNPLNVAAGRIAQRGIEYLGGYDASQDRRAAERPSR